jgi:hypothetical protein
MSGGSPALRTALAACQAAAYGYGVVGAHLASGEQRDAMAAYDEVRGQARQLAALASRAGGTPPAPQPAYALPFPVTDREAALRLAVHLEDGLAGVFYDLVAIPAPAVRGLAVTALVRAASRGAHWRAIGSLPPVTTAFPGRPR